MPCVYESAFNVSLFLDSTFQFESNLYIKTTLVGSPEQSLSWYRLNPWIKLNCRTFRESSVKTDIVKRLYCWQIFWKGNVKKGISPKIGKMYSILVSIWWQVMALFDILCEITKYTFSNRTLYVFFQLAFTLWNTGNWKSKFIFMSFLPELNSRVFILY